MVNAPEVEAATVNADPFPDLELWDFVHNRPIPRTDAEYTRILDWLRTRWANVVSFTVYPRLPLFLILFEYNGPLPNDSDIPMQIGNIKVVLPLYERYAPRTDPPFPFRGDNQVQTAEQQG
jgi:hypothetical protein